LVHGLETVFLATGHEGLGITTSLATGRLVADHLTEAKAEIPAEAYLPQRFYKRANAGFEGAAQESNAHA
jgi:glycine/D-amino acid oxidase-like deaminating enzyme